MIKHRQISLATVVVLAVLMILAGPVAAQNYWMQGQQASGIRLEIFKAEFDDLDDMEFLTTVWSLSGRAKVTDRLSVVVEFPVSNTESDDRGGETLIGNPYAGIELKLNAGDNSSCVVSRFGMRPPFAPDDKRAAASIGLATLYNRVEGFYPDWATIVGGLGYQHAYTGGTSVGVNGDLAYIIATDDGDNEMFFDYNAEVWQAFGKLNLAAGIAGRLWLTGEDLDFGERTEHQLAVAANIDLGKFRPGAHLRLPMEEQLTEIVDFIYGVNFAYDF